MKDHYTEQAALEPAQRVLTGFILGIAVFLLTAAAAMAGMPGENRSAGSSTVVLPRAAYAAMPGYYGSGGGGPSLTPPSDIALPRVDTIVEGATLEKTTNASLVVHQTDDHAVINWESFDIGRNAWTHFDQQGHTDWVALNRIYDSNPSQIFGRLTADGRVYLLNRNGILFGADSQVNVHSMIASSLDLSDENFTNNVLHFQAEDPASQSYVSNHGEIYAEAGGRIYLLAPNVENSGRIETPLGQVALAAGTDIRLLNQQDLPGQSQTTRVERLVSVAREGGGVAENFAAGVLAADQGVAGMYGAVVNQNGMIRSVSAVKKGGQIELIATDRTTLGPDSRTICPVSDSDEAVHESFEFTGGNIFIQSHNPDKPQVFNLVDDDAYLTGAIYHYGEIRAESGVVNLLARDRLYMDSGSVVDTSGSFAHLDAGANIVEAQLNSVEMRDDYGQKGELLQGEYIRFDAHAGSAVGNVSSHLSSEQKTAAEQAVNGGEIYLTALDGDLIVRQDALLDFSGGGVFYNSGMVETTKLVCGNRVYDIGDAPQWLAYDSVLGDYKRVHSRFGLVEQYSGISSGGVNSVMEYRFAHFEGADAGRIELHSPSIVLDGDLDGRASAGMYQTLSAVDVDELGFEVSRARVAPEGGEVWIGWKDVDRDDINYREIERMVIKPDVTPLTGITADAPVIERYPGEAGRLFASGEPVPTTYLSADKLNAAGLSSLILKSNTDILLESGAELSLMPGGNLEMYARQIQIGGDVDIPSGSVELHVNESVTSFADIGGSPNDRYVSMADLIYIGDGATLSVAGQRIDNTGLGDEAASGAVLGRLDGGIISLWDEIDAHYDENRTGLVIDENALLDVSGGYRIDPDGAVTGADAGELVLQGAVVGLNGMLAGYSLQGYDGGRFTLLTKSLAIGPAGERTGVNATLTLADDRFADTGFTDLTFLSVLDLTIAADAHLSPSNVKLADPVPDSTHGDALPNPGDEPENSGRTPVLSARQTAYWETTGAATVNVPDDFAGETRVTLRADAGSEYKNYENGIVIGDFQPGVTVSRGADIVMPPEGSIRIEGQHIAIAGSLVAPAGDIMLETDYNIDISGSTLLSAAGCNRPQVQSGLENLPQAHTPLPGGTVSLSAGGDLSIAAGAVLDVSGSEPVVNRLLTEGGEQRETLVAAEAGALELTYRDSFSLSPDAVLRGESRLEGISGGTFALRSIDIAKGLSVVSRGILDTATGQVTSLPVLTDGSGFDALILQSRYGIDFSRSMILSADRKLTLDAPLISVGNADVSLNAPWIVLQNTDTPLSMKMSEEIDTGSGRLTASADWIDVLGDVRISGITEEYGGLRLSAANDIRLQDRYYTSRLTDVENGWYGLLATAGNLDMIASRIYPAAESDFTLYSGSTFTTDYPETPLEGMVYSTAGRLTVLAQDIHHQGALLAPMGGIILAGDVNIRTENGRTISEYAPSGRVQLDPGSVLSTFGEAEVNYGAFDDQAISWIYIDRTLEQRNPQTPVSTAPEKEIRIEGAEVVQQDGAIIDTTGGGEMFAYQFLPGVEGTLDPLKRTDQYVILPGNAVPAPGREVYLEGTDNLAAGTYSLLPEEFAFVPGAMVVTDLGVRTNFAQAPVTEEGYAVSLGRISDAGGRLVSPVTHAWSVRPAADVLAEGNFTVSSMVSGDSGDITVNGATTLLGGAIVGNAAAQDLVDGYDGGTPGELSLSGVNIQIGAAGGQSGIAFGQAIGAEYENKLLIGADTLAGTGMGAIRLGERGSTETIEIASGSQLAASSVYMAAADTILVQDGAMVSATAADGMIAMTGGKQIDVRTGAAVSAHDVQLDTLALSNSGDIKAENSIVLQSDSIRVAADSYTGAIEDAGGLLLRESDIKGFGDVTSLALKSRSTLMFLGDVSLDGNGAGSGLETLIVEAGAIQGVGVSGQTGVRLSAAALQLRGTAGDVPEAAGLQAGGRIALHADDTLTVGSGNLDFEGFETVTLSGGGEVAFRGAGTLGTNGQHLELKGGRITTLGIETETLVRDGVESLLTYTPADYSIDTGAGRIDVQAHGDGAAPGAETSLQTDTAGGRLTMAAGGIDIAGTILLPAGRLTATAGNGGITLGSDARIMAAGTETAPGGRVTLASDAGGSVAVENGALIDVSAGAQGDAGVVTLSSLSGGVALDGTLQGAAAGNAADDGSSGGTGGSFYMETRNMDDVAAVADILRQGGFDNRIGLRIAEGDVSVNAPLTAGEIAITAEGGAIAVGDHLDAGGTEGGRVALNADTNVMLGSSGVVTAAAGGGDNDGGFVYLNAETGDVIMDGGRIDVSGAGAGRDGAVLLRAQRTANDIRMSLNGTVTGASDVSIEAVRIYTDTELNSGVVDTGVRSSWLTDTNAYMNALAASDAKGRLTGGLSLTGRDGAAVSPNALVRLEPGIEVRSSADLKLAADWNLTEWRFAGEAGGLTLRTAGDLRIDGALTDAPSGTVAPTTPSGAESWDLRFVSGADTDSADIMAVNLDAAGGDLYIADQKNVYTEAGRVWFASGRDVVLGAPVDRGTSGVAAIPYALKTYSGEIRGYTGRDLDLNGNDIQSAVGDIDILAGRDVLAGVAESGQKSRIGSIRTIGRSPSGEGGGGQYWLYADGGDIRLDAGGVVAGTLNSDAWDARMVSGYDETLERIMYAWGASYEGWNASQGIVSLAGGNVLIATGRDFISQTGAFSQGDVRIHSGGDLDGRFMVSDGAGDFNALGNFGMNGNMPGQQIELMAADATVNAQGSVYLGTVLNPTVAGEPFFKSAGNADWVWNLTYTYEGQADPDSPGNLLDNTAIRLNASRGDILLSGETEFSYGQAFQGIEHVLPPVVAIEAGRDINIERAFVMAPSPTGNLELAAGRDIDAVYYTLNATAFGGFHMSDLAPSSLYGEQTTENWTLGEEDKSLSVKILSSLLTKTFAGAHAPEAVHANDPNPIGIAAGNDIVKLKLFLPKKAEITAGNDMLDIYYYGQNVNAGDVSLIQAGNAIQYTADISASVDANKGILHGGPGYMLVSAAGAINLGTSRGIQSMGSTENPYLPDTGGALAVVSGYDLEKSAGDFDTFFSELKTAGQEMTTVFAEEGVEAGSRMADEIEETLITPFLDGAADDADALGDATTTDIPGDLNMVLSQINSKGSGTDLYIVANGEMNVGRSTFATSSSQSTDTGIYTVGGGDICLYAEGDINVNESRVMTFYGGDVLGWSNSNINAGRGSRTAINAEPARPVKNENGEYEVVFNPPAVGSGVRALTFDPDGVTGPQPEAPLGDIYLFAPYGEIDAGEAGIAGSNVFLAAVSVVNVQNISFSAGAVGVPSTSEAAVGVGALSGVGAVNEAGKMAEAGAALEAANKRFEEDAKAMEKTFMPTWLRVEFMGFDVQDGGWSEDDEDDDEN